MSLQYIRKKNYYKYYLCIDLGQFKFERIGSEFTDDIPLFGLRFVPALCGSLIIPVAYQLMLELGCRHWCAALAAFLLLCGNYLFWFYVYLID